MFKQYMAQEECNVELSSGNVLTWRPESLWGLSCKTNSFYGLRFRSGFLSLKSAENQISSVNTKCLDFLISILIVLATPFLVVNCRARTAGRTILCISSVSNSRDIRALFAQLVLLLFFWNLFLSLWVDSLKLPWRLNMGHQHMLCWDSLSVA